VAGGERIRLFCALQLPPETVERLVPWQLAALPPDRVVPPEKLHVTLAFLGSRPVDDVPAVVAALVRAAAGAAGIELSVRGYRETRSVGMLTFDDRGGAATAVAEALQADLEAGGLYRRESRPWLPHVTVLRFRERPRLRPRLPELGAVSPSDAAVYLSRLRPGGAQYEVLTSVALGGM
jgi:2'-5' RNA ligase